MNNKPETEPFTGSTDTPTPHAATQGEHAKTIQNILSVRPDAFAAWKGLSYWRCSKRIGYPQDESGETVLAFIDAFLAYHLKTSTDQSNWVQIGAKKVSLNRLRRPLLQLMINSAKLGSFQNPKANIHTMIKRLKAVLPDAASPRQAALKHHLDGYTFLEQLIKIPKPPRAIRNILCEQPTEPPAAPPAVTVEEPPPQEPVTEKQKASPKAPPLQPPFKSGAEPGEYGQGLYLTPRRAVMYLPKKSTQHVLFFK